MTKCIPTSTSYADKATSTKCLTVWEFCAGRYARITTTGGRIFCATRTLTPLDRPMRKPVNSVTSVDVEPTEPSAVALENNAALVYEDGAPVKTLSSGGRVFSLTRNGEAIEEKELLI